MSKASKSQIEKSIK